MKFRILVAACLLAAAASASAHNGALADRSCSGGQFVTVATFSFTQSQLIDYEACLNAPNTTACTEEMPLAAAGCTTETCGEFDDDYGVAYRLAYNFCETYDTSSSGSGLGSAVASVEGPVQFGWSTHHQDYHFSGGLNGICRRCSPYTRR